MSSPNGGVGGFLHGDTERSRRTREKLLDLRGVDPLIETALPWVRLSQVRGAGSRRLRDCSWHGESIETRWRASTQAPRRACGTHPLSTLTGLPLSGSDGGYFVGRGALGLLAHGDDATSHHFTLTGRLSPASRRRRCSASIQSFIALARDLFGSLVGCGLPIHPFSAPIVSHRRRLRGSCSRGISCPSAVHR